MTGQAADAGGHVGGLGCSAEAPSADAWQVAAALVAPQVAGLSTSTSAPGAGSNHHGSGASAAAGCQPPPLHILRSSQVDALRLDAELSGMLQEQMVKLFDHFRPGQAAALEPEVRAVLSLLVFGLSVWGGAGTGRATPGSELLNLRYRNEWAVAADKACVGRSGVDGPGLSRGQRVALGLGTVALPYAWARLCRAAHAGEWAEAEEGSWRRRVWGAMRQAEGAVAAAALANSWLFLVRGDYRTLLERLLGCRLVWRQAAMSRIISFEYLNRQLVWQELSEALLLLLPMVDLARLRRAVLRALPRPQSLLSPLHGVVAAAAAADGAVAETEAAGGAVEGGTPLPAGATAKGAGGAAGARKAAASSPANTACPVCGSSDMLTAVVALPCRHVFCYYCLRAHTAADVAYACPLDGMRVAAMRRLRPVAAAAAAGTGGAVAGGGRGGLGTAAAAAAARHS
ncbi:hypothetical protein HXX76_016096 [Chlamydomonas incerta]|uniref:RING-type E3 ubiquitin transferase (cysteine targeting) n=1 Tax=Chlamydomonas incerta TaxID=51695 RepID=A0A835SB68_CHLIN|nr:hypothetical protein HXX76_016096 [Chlamydomonas incerta]|eukprot:KAG2422371.1 hypothetical protein HXX76_016096 [Chlamydomonas incerta]